MIDPQDLLTRFLLSLVIYREARGEPLDGKLAVGHVIRNRREDKRWPDTYVDVILQPYQFSCFNRADPQVALYPKAANDRAWSECVQAAMEVLKGAPDVTHGANHYHTIQLKPLPKWALNEPPVVTIANHVFYRL